MSTQDNMAAAEQTYTGFLSVLKFGTIASLAVGALVILLIAN